MTLGEWEKKGQRWISRILKGLQTVPASQKALERLGEGPFSVELLCVQRGKSRQINFEHRGVDRETDVLSFPVPSRFAHPVMTLGSLVVCVPVMREQARVRKLDPEMEFVLLLVHGILHLLGWDHEQDVRELREMAAVETAVLERVVPKGWVRETQGRCLLGLIERVQLDTD